jgi:hypothetical protein
MKITGLKTFVVANPPPRRGGRYFIFLKLVTDNGIEGVGEVYNATFAPDVIVKMIEDVFQRNVEGMDPFRIERSGGALTRAAIPCGPTSRWLASCPASRWPCGTSVERLWISLCMSCWEAVYMSGCAPTRICMPRRMLTPMPTPMKATRCTTTPTPRQNARCTM